MVTKLSHATLYVTDQNKALDFYSKTLGFKVHTDATMESGFRWLAVTPPDQPDLHITLLSPLNEFMYKDEDVRAAFKLLLDKGALGAGVFYTPDCRATYEELKAKGVVFRGEPKEQFYGIEAILTDGCGNWFSMTQPKQI
ncbi:MAG: glyoxalase [Bacteroidetes bacterium]|nr:MAG: glyoxalase [Bacteroidota bacterium]